MYPGLDELGDFLACYFIGFNLQFIAYFPKIILADRTKNKVHETSFEFDCTTLDLMSFHRVACESSMAGEIGRRGAGRIRRRLAANNRRISIDSRGSIE